MLIVEDEPLVALMLEDYVEEMGCRFAVTTGSTAPALETIENMEPDFVILDVLMKDEEPDFTIADELAARHIPFIFCSGHHRNILPDRHRSTPFISKPFGDDELVSALRQCRLRK